MTKKQTYQDFLRAEMRDIISQLNLPDLYKRSLEQRWLDQVIWMDKKADQCRRWHYRLRLTTIIGGVILPALVSISLSDDPANANLKRWTSVGAFGLSQVVAISAAIEEFCRFGDRWRQYRQTVETLKTEGWQYLQSSGAYQKNKNHQDGYPLFAARIENIIQKDVQVYITEVIKERKDDDERERLAQYSPEMMASNLMSAWSNPVIPPTSTSTPGTDTTIPPQAAPVYPAGAPAYYPGASGPETPTQPGYPAVAAPALTNNSGVATAAPPMAMPPISPAPVTLTPVIPAAGGNWQAEAGVQLKVLADTVFKLSARPEDQLGDAEKVLVKGGSVYTLHSHAAAENQHVKVALAGVGLGPDHRNTWYVTATQVEIEGTEPGNQPDDRDHAPEPHGQAVRMPGLSTPVYLSSPIIPDGHFTWAEATKNGSRIPVDDDVVEGIIRIAKVLEEVRVQLGNRPMKINSWYRDPASNRRAGGASKSRHMSGDAVDFVVDGINPFEVYRQLEPWWGSRGGLASSSRFTHIDARGYKARWRYPS